MTTNEYPDAAAKQRAESIAASRRMQIVRLAIVWLALGKLMRATERVQLDPQVAEIRSDLASLPAAVGKGADIEPFSRAVVSYLPYDSADGCQLPSIGVPDAKTLAQY